MKTELSRFFRQALVQAASKHDADRRKFIKQSLVATTALAALPFLGYNATPKRIAIVGAGLAGLNVAYQLQKKNVLSTVYEASSRVGGRILTKSNFFENGIHTELGGEFIDETHVDILTLVQEMGLETYDLRQANQGNIYALFFENRLIALAEVVEALEPHITRILEDAYLAKVKPEIAVLLDKLSVIEYLKNIGIGGWLFELIAQMNTLEYGMDSGEQSALNLLLMLEMPTENDPNYRFYGNAHEVFKIKKGNEQLPQALAKRLQNPVVFDYKLQKITQNDTGTYLLSFVNQQTLYNVEADFVVLALPFTILRKLDLDIALSDDKKRAINELGYGNSAKLILGFKQRRWNKLGYQGNCFSKLPLGSGWDSSQLQNAAEAGSFTIFTAAQDAVNLQKIDETSAGLQGLASLERIFPDIQKAYNNKILKICWADNPLVQAGYSCYKVGQWTSIAGFEAASEDNVFFAGEHTSANFQGYMNGAAESGRIAAAKILSRL